jgi:adenosylcobinamide-phosphate synthase
VLRAAPALLLEALVRYPPALERRISHPVVWIGRGLEGLEAAWNRPGLRPGVGRALGAATLALSVGGAMAVSWPIERLRRRGWLGSGLALAAALPGLAQLSLYDHVDEVRRALNEGELERARTAVGRIVGRDVDALDASGVAAAAIESLAESFNDGVTAPALWLMLGGLPGLWAYKAVNTADSLIGHMEPRWRHFGWAAAKLDDLANLPPARLAGVLLALAGGGGWAAMLRDSGKTASPNAGWPEAAMAGALGVQLGGPARYDGLLLDRPRLGEGPRPDAADLDRALGVYVRACRLLVVVLGLVEVLGGRKRR